MIEPQTIPDTDTAPGDPHADSINPAAGLISYGVGLGFAVLLTVVAFILATTTHLVWQPSIPVALCVLAVGQMAIHLIFFLHITSGPDNFNNVMALAFGVIIVFLLIVGSLYIMSNMNQNMMPMAGMLQSQQ
ncbi:MAG TPA: cytochrome o ubiquinol oxidase subunit IV [Rhodopila sp.]|jgi:cytochrome o ubiquinol oxidase operon protein cyoD|nr:cytochrome o ubiquinol oxidase subunit IV [Rhodopila sp.]